MTDCFCGHRGICTMCVLDDLSDIRGAVTTTGRTHTLDPRGVADLDALTARLAGMFDEAKDDRRALADTKTELEELAKKLERCQEILK